MPYAVTLGLDPQSAVRVRALWDALARDGLSDDAVLLGYDPHLTLAIHDDAAAPDALIGAVRRATTGWGRMTLTCAALAVFPANPATLWIAPTVTAQLLHRHSALCAALPGATLHAHYRPGTWMPHITLADDLATECIGMAMAAAAPLFQPFTASLERIEIVRFRPVIGLWQARLS